MLLTTALHSEHQALGATLVDFGGWDMPLWYPTGAVKEHMAVINGAGLFDIGHMAGLLLSGPDALAALQWAFTKDIALSGPRAAYGAFLNEKAHVVDDAIVYPLSEGRYFIVMNVGHADAIAQCLHKAAAHLKASITVRDLAGTYIKIDLQGPAAPKIMATLLANVDDVLGKMPYFTFKGDIEFAKTNVFLTDGTPTLLSRTGYTGEMGFEIFVPLDKAVSTWKQLLAAGEPFGLIPCGLAARDSLRAGAVLPLSGQDLGAWTFVNNPWPFTLPLDADGKWTKDFEGRSVIDAERAKALHTLVFCGFDPRKVTSADHDKHPKAMLGDTVIGDVITCVADTACGRVDGVIVSVASPDKPEGFNPKGLVCGYIRVDRALAPGTRVTLADERRKIEVEIVSDIRPARTARKALVYR